MSDPASLRSSSTNMKLVIAPNALATGATYTFSVEWRDSQGGLGIAFQTFTTRTPPYAGKCLSDPASGAALKTKFLFQCTDWVADGSSLRYAFQIVGGALISQGYQQKGTLEAILGPAQEGSSTNAEGDSLVDIEVIGLDSWGLSSSMTFSVAVSFSAEDFSYAVDPKVVDAAANGDIQTVSQAIVGNLAALDHINSGSTGSSNAAEAGKLRGEMLDVLVVTSGNVPSSTALQVMQVLNAVTNQPAQLFDKGRACPLQGHAFSALASHARTDVDFRCCTYAPLARPLSLARVLSLSQAAG